MNIEPKSAALLEAQTEKFLLNEYPKPLERPLDHKMSEAAGLLLELDMSLVADREILDTYAGSRASAWLPSQYKCFLTGMTTDEHREMRDVVAYIERYKKFQPYSEQVESNMIAQGNSSVAYRIDVDGKAYIVRKMHADDGLPQVDKHLRAALRLADIPHIEHIVAASYQALETVAPLINGKDLWTLNEDEQKNITQQQFDELYASLRLANERGVGFDGIGDNLIYDPAEGFTAIDLGLFDHFHTSAAQGIYENLTVKAEKATYELRQGTMPPATVKLVANMCRHLADTLQRGSETGAEWLARRLLQRATDLDARLETFSTRSASRKRF